MYLMLCLIQESDKVFLELDEEFQNVRDKAEAAAAYFCDSRDTFRDKIFQEMWSFTCELKKTAKVKQYYEIQYISTD